MSQHLVWIVAACGQHDVAIDAASATGTLVAGGASFQAESDIAGSGRTVAVAYMDRRASSASGADNAATIRIAVSSDGGRTFGPTRAVDDSRAVDQFDPSIAMRADGTTVVGWFEDDGAGSRHVRVAVAPHPDAAFRVAPPVDDGSDEVDRPWLAIAPDGTIHVMWVGAPAHRLHFAHSSDGGATFSPPIASTDTGFMSGCLAIASDGTLFAVTDQYEGAFAQAPRILVARSRDGGASFDPPVVAGTRTRAGRIIPRCAIAPGTPPQVAVPWAARTGSDDPSSPTVLDADLFIATSDGATASTPIAVPAPAGLVPVAVPPAIAVDDAMHVLFYARSSAGWETFAATGPVGQPPAAHALSLAPWPGMRVTASGVDITTWLGDTEGLVALPGGVVAGFSENRTGDADAFAAIVP
jgi:hypothetical protein